MHGIEDNDNLNDCMQTNFQLMNSILDKDSPMTRCRPTFCYLKGMQQENDNQDSAGLSPFGNFRSRKDAHKCQHCGKFISGHVAYRGEIVIFFDPGENHGRM